SNRASLTLQPNWPQIFSGETITLRCEIQGGGDTQWTYEWKPDKLNIPPRHSEYRINSATESHSGEYRCKGRKDSYSSTEWSNVIRLNVSLGGTVTLTCSVRGSPDWKYYWFKHTSDSSEAQLIRDGVPDRVISVSQGGLYHCRGGRGDPLFFTENSDKVTIQETISNRASFTLQPNWPQIFSGETITLRCEIQGGGDTQWTYEWKPDKLNIPPTHSEYRINSATESHSGRYRCKGRKDSYSSTEWSNVIRLNVSHKPQPVLTLSPLWLSPGDSVTLNCEVEHPSAGWRFYWYKAVPDLSSNYYYSSELLPDSSNGTEQDSYIVHGQTHTAGYKCRAGRGDPVYYTQDSKPKFVWSGDFHPSASLTVSPDRVQHFTSDSVLVSCEGNSAEWKVMRFPENRYWSHCSSWGTMTGSTCNIYSNQQSNAVYWCESGSGEFSNAVYITIHKTDIILVSPVHPVTEGDSVSLSCRLRRQTFKSNVFFYLNEKLIQNDTRRELNISAVSKSDEGFYKCQYSQQVSAQSWMSVNAVSTPSFPVPLIVGLVCGIVLIILLLLLYRYRLSKSSCCIRSNQSESINQDSNTDHVVYQNTAECNAYSDLFHGGVSLYETIRSPKEDENGMNEEPEESPVYANVTMGSATGLCLGQLKRGEREKMTCNKGQRVRIELRPLQ
uniref:Ig-like domain-containing protein n=1 Tax=Dicentrarchus labrax TaxID=13489 RepID=A0A8C4HXK0_DICLA